MISAYAANLATQAVLAEATHVAIFTADPLAAGDQNDEQPNATGYARQAITWTTSGSGSESNVAAVEFEPDGGDWTNGPWLPCLVTSGTYGAGEVLAVSVDGNGDPKFTTADEVLDGVALQFNVGALTFGFPSEGP